MSLMHNDDAFKRALQKERRRPMTKLERIKADSMRDCRPLSSEVLWLIEMVEEAERMARYLCSCNDEMENRGDKAIYDRANAWLVKAGVR